MKTKNIIILALSTFFLCFCSGSETYRGSWKATDLEGNKYIIQFEPKKFTIKKLKGKTKSYDYGQYNVNIHNGVETYGISLSDGRNYKIHFPFRSEETAFIHMDHGGDEILTLDNVLYTINRKNFKTYEEAFDVMNLL